MSHYTALVRVTSLKHITVEADSEDQATERLADPKEWMHVEESEVIDWETEGEIELDE